MLHPSPALTVRADTSISDCVRLMRKYDVGSVLVMSDLREGELVGIFTERDLLRKIELLAVGENLGRPIRTVMTRAVTTIDVSRLDDAGRIMLDGGFRHLPIVSADSGARPRLAGVVSMRDLLRSQVEDAESRTGRKPTQPGRIVVLSSDPGLLAALGRLAKAVYEPGRITRVQGTAELFEKAWPALPRMKLVVIDLDGYRAEDWASALRRINREPNAPLAVVVYTPELLSRRTLKIVTQLGNSRGFAAFAKPLNIVALLDELAER